MDYAAAVAFLSAKIAQSSPTNIADHGVGAGLDPPGMKKTGRASRDPYSESHSDRPAINGPGYYG